MLQPSFILTCLLLICLYLTFFLLTCLLLAQTKCALWFDVKFLHLHTDLCLNLQLTVVVRVHRNVCMFFLVHVCVCF